MRSRAHGDGAIAPTPQHGPGWLAGVLILMGLLGGSVGAMVMRMRDTRSSIMHWNRARNGKHARFRSLLHDTACDPASAEVAKVAAGWRQRMRAGHMPLFETFPTR